METASRKVGMYGETPSVKVGEFTLSRMNSDEDCESIWIEHESGEGGEFQENQLEKVIAEFYDKHF